MSNIKNIGDYLMIHARDHKTAYMFDPWDYLGPKSRKIPDNSWAGLFQEHILAELPVSRLASYYAEDFGRPTKELYAALGALMLQQMHDLTDEETVAQFSFNLQRHYVLDIPGESDKAKYLSVKTLWTLRQRVMEMGLDIALFDTVHCNDCPLRNKSSVHEGGKKRHYLRCTRKALRVAERRAQERTDEFKDKYRWRAGVEATFSEMVTTTGSKNLRVRGMRAVSYCARLKAIVVNLFGAALVKRACKARKADPGGGLSGIGSLIYAVKEQFLSRWRRLRDIFVLASGMERYRFNIAD